MHEYKIKKMYFKWFQLIHMIPKSWEKGIKINQLNCQHQYVQDVSKCSKTVLFAAFKTIIKKKYFQIVNSLYKYDERKWSKVSIYF